MSNANTSNANQEHCSTIDLKQDFKMRHKKMLAVQITANMGG